MEKILKRFIHTVYFHKLGHYDDPHSLYTLMYCGM